MTIAEHDRPIRCAKGMRVLPDHTFADAPALDVAAWCRAAAGSRVERENPAMLDYLRRRRARLHLGHERLHRGVRARGGRAPARTSRVTTHWASIERAPRADARTSTVLEDIRYVRDGNVVTAAGVSAGIDMALWVLGQVYLGRARPDAPSTSWSTTRRRPTPRSV